MKQKLILLIGSMLGIFAVRANAGTGDPGLGKKDDVLGYVIHAESRKPLKDVSVTAYFVSKKEKIVLTEEDGSFSFDDLKPGTYRFVFEKAGYKKITKEKVVIKTDEAYQLNIEMIESNDFDIMPSPSHFSGI
jgi:hypothetical protein